MFWMKDEVGGDDKVLCVLLYDLWLEYLCDINYVLKIVVVSRVSELVLFEYVMSMDFLGVVIVVRVCCMVRCIAVIVGLSDMEFVSCGCV